MKAKVKYWMGVVSVLILGCTGSTIIPQNDMVLIIKQIYMADGVVSVSESGLSNKDSIAYYEPILQKYGYTTAEFDSSIKYYAQHTEEFDEIFDKVILELSKLQEQFDSDSLNVEDVDSTLKSDNNLWPHKTKWDMTIDHTHNPSLSFNIPVKGMGTYTVSFDAQVFPQDKSEETRVYLYFYYDDKTPTGKRTNVISEYYIKDSLKRSFSHKLTLTDSLVTHLKGELYDHGGESKNLVRKALFENISINYEKVKSDSLIATPNQKLKRFVKNQRMKLRKNIER